MLRAALSGNDDGVGTAARFNGLKGLAIDRGSTYLYASDFANNIIRRISLSTTGPAELFSVITIATGISGPWGLVLDQTDSNLYAVGSNANAIFKIPIAVNGIEGVFPIQVNSNHIIAGSTSGSNIFLKSFLVMTINDYFTKILFYLRSSWKC